MVHPYLIPYHSWLLILLCFEDNSQPVPADVEQGFVPLEVYLNCTQDDQCTASDGFVARLLGWPLASTELVLDLSRVEGHRRLRFGCMQYPDICSMRVYLLLFD